MREIKFRAWKMHNGKLRRCVFSPFDILDYAHRHPEAPVMHNQDVNDIRDFIPDADVIEQFTGFKDKNGKEIYEGDIVDDGYSRICEIRWSEHFTALEAINENDGYVSNIWFVAKYGEVIGNIHENPELLEKEK